MNFTPDKAIYLQIADRICDQILAGEYAEEARIRHIKQQRRTQFIDEQLPALFRNMQLLGIGIEEVTDAWHKKMDGD